MLNVSRCAKAPSSSTDEDEQEVWRERTAHMCGLFTSHALGLGGSSYRQSAEVIETAKRIGHDMYTYINSFAEEVPGMDGPKLQVPANVFHTWLTRFTDKCSRHGLDWLTTAVKS